METAFPPRGVFQRTVKRMNTGLADVKLSRLAGSLVLEISSSCQVNGELDTVPVFSSGMRLSSRRNVLGVGGLRDQVGEKGAFGIPRPCPLGLGEVGHQHLTQRLHSPGLPFDLFLGEFLGHPKLIFC